MCTTAIAEAIDHDRRRLLSTAAMGIAVAGTSGLLPADLAAATEDNAIRPFNINVPEEELVDLRRRIAAMRWPEKETVADQSQGVQLGTMQELARYWATEYDWRKCEAKLNALPQFITEIDGLDIHFIHVRSKHENALPLIITHGWPGSIIEQLKIIDPLANPTAHGCERIRCVPCGDTVDARATVSPGKPTNTGWGPERMGSSLDSPDEPPRLQLATSPKAVTGGAFVVDQMGLQAPAGLLAIHTNTPSTVPADADKTLLTGGPAPSGLSAERRAYEQLVRT